MRLPPLNKLQAFEATARLLSMSRAGEELFLTHAAISHQLKSLESWFGRRLFQRSGRGIALTSVGEEFLRAVQGALASIELSATKLRIKKDRNNISVACIPSIASRWLVPALPEFSRKYPDISVQINYARALENLEPEQFDVLITTHKNDNIEKETCIKLFSRANRPVASRALVKSQPHLLAAGGFESAPLLHDETKQSWNEWFASADYQPKNIKHGPVYQDFNLLATAVIAGHGIALCPVEVFRREISDGDLVVLSDIATLEDQGYYMIFENSPNPALTCFIEWFIGICNSSINELKELGVMKQDSNAKFTRSTTNPDNRAKRRK